MTVFEQKQLKNLSFNKLGEKLMRSVKDRVFKKDSDVSYRSSYKFKITELEMYSDKLMRITILPIEVNKRSAKEYKRIFSTRDLNKVFRNLVGDLKYHNPFEADPVFKYIAKTYPQIRIHADFEKIK